MLLDVRIAKLSKVLVMSIHPVRFKKTVLGIFAALIIGTGAPTAVQAMESLNTTGHERHIVAQANHGDAQSQYRLATMYLDGRGVPKDRGEAMEWLRKSALQGNVDATTLLRMMYDKSFAKVAQRR